tara:strand:- start:40951 stop:42858 length:1908 start_codon:yes stop_codon:yes gene_type:complete
LLSCSTTKKIRKSEPVPATPQVKEVFQRAQSSYASGNYEKAQQDFKYIIQNFPNMAYANESLFSLGLIYEKQNKAKQAFEAYISIVQSPYFSGKEFSARIKVAELLIAEEKYDEALSYLDSVTRTDQVKKPLLEKAHLLRIDIFQYKQQDIQTLETLIELSQITEKQASKEAYRMRALDIVNSNLTKEELMQIVGNRDFDFVRSAAFYQLGKMFFEQKEFSRASSYLSSAISVNSKSKYAELAQHILDQIRARSRTEPYTIGAVLPLSGKLAPIGERSLRGIQLGLGIFDKDRSRFTLSVIDSESNADSARAAVEKLVIEDNVIAIVGSLLSKTATEVATKANDLGVPSFALSQKDGLHEIGDNVFRHALTSKMQVEAIVTTAMQDLKMRRFAILYPEDPYGKEFANLFWDEVERQGGEINAVEKYESGETDFKTSIRKLVGTYYKEARQDEFDLRLAEWKEKNPNSRRNPPSDLLPPIVDFDAIFIPDSSRAIGQIAPMLDYNDVDGVRLLGTNLWNTRSFLNRIGKYGKQTLFVDTYSENQDTKSIQAFNQKYEQVYGQKPDSLVIQSYEAAKILRYLIENGARSRERLQSKLLEIKGFPGVTGKLDMSSNREINKPVRSLSVTAGSISPLEL